MVTALLCWGTGRVVFFICVLYKLVVYCNVIKKLNK